MASIEHLPSGKWRAQVRLRGHQQKTASFRTKAQAQAWATRTEDQMRSGAYRDTALAETKTLAELLRYYEAEITPRKAPSALKRERSRIGILLRASAFNSASLAAVTSERVVAFIDARRRDGMSADTIKKELGTLSQALEVAQSLLGIELPRGNPVKQVREGLQHTKTMRVNPSRDRRISASEESAILRQLTPLMQSAVALLLETAMRRGELCTAKRAHVSGATLHIPDTKTDQARTIPLSMRALEIMQALPSRSDGLLIGLRPDSVTQAFARACKRAGIVDLRPHDLRHEAVSRLFERGLSIPEVSLVTGHTEWKSLKRYTNLRAEDLVAKLK